MRNLVRFRGLGVVKKKRQGASPAVGQHVVIHGRKSANAQGRAQLLLHLAGDQAQYAFGDVIGAHVQGLSLIHI